MVGNVDQELDRYWREIWKHQSWSRNKWFIKLRYGAVAMMSGLVIGIEVINHFSDSYFLASLPLWVIAAVILLYNFAFHLAWSRFEFIEFLFPSIERIHLSIAQICVDFVALISFIYFTGGVENPLLYGFFIFHVIIGSLLLPGWIVYLIMTCVLAVTTIWAILEMHCIIPHYGIHGLLNAPLYQNKFYLLIFFSVFGLTIYISIYLANTIARQLYKRERLLVQAYHELEEAEKSKSHYVMMVVHDLKSPIAAATTYLNMLIDGTLGKLEESHLKPIQRAKTRLDAAIGTIDTILSISQLVVGTHTEKIETIDLNLLWQDVVQEMLPIITAKNFVYTYCAPPNHPVHMEGEAELLKLALRNLLSNACKYTEENGSIEITIEEEDQSVIVSVADSGLGIPHDEREKIFENFYRTAVVKKKGIEGTGLGMSLVKEIMKRYHGDITIESPSYLKKNENLPGTEFTLRFPKKYQPKNIVTIT